MMDHQINDKDGQCNGNAADSQQQEGLESTITSGHVLDHVQCQSQRVTTMATRTPSSLPMKPQLDAGNTYVTDSTNTTIPSSSSIGTVEYQNQHGSSYFANALTTLQMQHALKLAVNANSQQQQNFSEGFPNSSSQATMYNGARSANTLSPPLNHHLNQFPSSGSSSSATMTIPTGLPTTPIVTSSPSSTLASAARLASMGVAFGRGVNPNIPNPQAALNGGSVGSTGTGNANSLSNGGMGMVNQNNPPIVNTGNNGPMCVQPGDWVCLQCGFVNWRRRKICMRCYPLLDQSNELSRSIMNGANLAAQIAAGIEPSPELLASLTTTNAKKTSNIQSTSTSNSSSQSPAYHSQQPYSTNLNYANNDLITPTSSSLQTVSSSSVLRTYQQNGYIQNQDETVDNSLAWSLQNGLNMSDTQQAAATTTNMHNHTSGNRMFSSNRPSPMQTPLPSSTFDNNSTFSNLPPIAKPSHSIRQSQSFSMLSSLNGFTSCSTGNVASPYTSNSKSAFATPKEEKQFSKAQELWFGNKQLSEASVPLANGGGLRSAKTAMVWNTNNHQEEKGQAFSEFRFSSAKPSISKNDNVNGLSDQIENNFSFTTAYKQDSNEPSYEPVKVSAANESDEIVVPCGNEVSKALQEYPQQQQLPQKSSFNRLLPIGKAAIEPPSSSSSSSSSSILTTKPRSTTCSSSSSTSSSTLKPAAATSLTQASSFDQQHQNYQV